MGVDFIQRTKRTFEKHLDVQRAHLATADLFTREPTDCSPTLVARLTSPAAVKEGQELIAEIADGEVIFSVGHVQVGTAIKPNPVVVAAIADSCGVAAGVVEVVHAISQTAEIRLC